MAPKDVEAKLVQPVFQWVDTGFPRLRAVKTLRVCTGLGQLHMLLANVYAHPTMQLYVPNLLDGRLRIIRIVQRGNISKQKDIAWVAL